MDDGLAGRPGGTIRAPTATEWLAATRDRREMWRQAYLQGTSRSSQVVTVATVVGGVAVAGVDWGALVVRPSLVVQFLAILTAAAAVLASLAASYPPVGRRFTGFPTAHRLLAARRASLAERLALAPADVSFAWRRPERAELPAFAGALILPYAATTALDLDDPVLVADLYLAWSTWFVMEQLAGLLRLAVRTLVAAAALVAAGWIFKEVGC